MDDDTHKVTEIRVNKPTTPIEHGWIQRGRDLMCDTCPHPHTSIDAVPVGMMLTKNDKGEFDFVAM